MSEAAAPLVESLYTSPEGPPPQAVKKENRNQPRLIDQYGFGLIHLTPLLMIWSGFTWKDWLVCLFMYYFRMFFISAGYHRYFSHKTYETSRFFQFLIAFFAQTSIQKGALWWASQHRIHHRYSDTAHDPHSANIYGFFYAHIGWIMGPDYQKTRYDLIQDFAKYPELRFLNRFFMVPPIIMAVIIYFIGNMLNGQGLTDWNAGWSTVVVGYLTSTVILYHGTFSINSLMHKIGRRRYRTKDHSRNNAVLALITMGEGWHNNHHYYQGSCRQGFFWWEFDPSYYVLKTLALFGIVWNIRPVPVEVKYGSKRLDGKKPPVKG